MISLFDSYSFDLNSLDQAGEINQYSYLANPDAATRTLRRVAARNLGLDHLVSYGDMHEYRALPPEDQVRMNDEMARLILRYPQSYPAEIIDAAQGKISSPYYGTGLENTGYLSTTIDRLADGTLVESSATGGLEYVKNLGLIAVIGLITVAAFKS